jgi:Multiubiquitin
MSVSQTSKTQAQNKGKGSEVTVKVNTKPVVLPDHRVKGLQVKEAAIDQGVEIQPDFLLTLEAHEGQPARTIDDDEFVTVTKHSEFTANDVDDDS